MFRHDTIHAEACRLARYAAKCRAAGDEVNAKRYEAKALALVGQLPSRSVTEWRPRARRCLAAALGLLALCALPGVAEARGPAKPRKPTVCLDYELVSSKGEERGAICYDGTKPKLMTPVVELVIQNPETGVPSRVVVGF